ncbi:hypothetical protein TNCV_1188021 [Trichonephila clavipes]|nr:hypothetical protein TNCV_1188021 [Trichonephila clavipes]
MTTAREDCVFISRPRSPMKEGMFVLGTFRSERIRILYRSRQDDRLRVMLVLSSSYRYHTTTAAMQENVATIIQIQLIFLT